MYFTLRRSRPGPIAVDLGSGSIKMLQLGAKAQRITVACESTVPLAASASPDQYLDWLEHALPELFQTSMCVGRQVILALPSTWTTVQHLQLSPAEAPNASEIAPMMLPPMDEEALTQIVEVGPVESDGQSRIEFICFATSRRLVFRVMDLLHRLRYNVVDLRTQFGAAIAAFDHVHTGLQMTGSATLYVDIGTGGIRAAVTNGARLVQARCISTGGTSIEHNAAHMLQSSSTMLASVIDELRMMLRHDSVVFPDRHIERVIFLGHGAHFDDTCKQIVESLHLPGQRGDPLAPFVRPDDLTSPVCLKNGPKPEWASVAGLAAPPLQSQEISNAA